MTKMFPPKTHHKMTDPAMHNDSISDDLRHATDATSERPCDPSDYDLDTNSHDSIIPSRKILNSPS